MHPIFQSKTGLWFYLALWIPFGLLFAFVLRMSGGLRGPESAAVVVPAIVILALECLLPWYYARYLPLRSTPPWKLVAAHLIAAICASVVALLPPHIVAAFSSRAFPDLSVRLHPALPLLAGIVVLIYLLSVSLHYVFFAVESSRQAELLSREAELKALKAQVNPHFLFNSLNSISALTTTDPAKARDMCVRLSEFLRTSLRLGERVSVPFAEELALTKTYLDVEQVRFGARLRVSQDFDAGCSDCEVPPLLVQPLVENAIKHGIATLAEGGEIAMSGRRMQDGIRVAIENPFDPEAPETRRNGFGLASVRNRLHTRYGNAARMEIQVEGNQYRVTLLLPYEGARQGGRR